MYTLYQELAETSNSSYALIQRAVSRVQNDQRVKRGIKKEGDNHLISFFLVDELFW